MNQDNKCLDFYRGKTILLTGSTGFVGKVLLDKILRTFPELNGIYLLIRGKKGSSIVERFKKEVIGSQCFDRLKKLKGHTYDEFITNKVFPIEGDLNKDGLGLSAENIERIIDNVDVIINCAASVDFNASIREALEVNYFGTMRMLELGKRCRKLENFVHVSTAYVNCDKLGFIEEKIYESTNDVEKLVGQLMKNGQNLSEKQTQEIIGKFPNTYTFTKSLSERMLMKKKPANMSITIVRPSIVGCSFRDPFPGWIDNMIGSAAIYFYSGIGLVKIFKGNEELIGDQIPVDFVADFIIVAGAYNANGNNLEVYHCSSSLRNPVTWKLSKEMCLEYWNQNVPNTRVSNCNVVIRKSVLYYDMVQLSRKVPALLYKQAANVLGNANMKKNANRWMKFLEKAHMINETFKYFNNNEWIYDQAKTINLLQYLSDYEQQVFLLDVTIINWRSYLRDFNYGLQKYILKENVDPPGNPESTDLFSLWKVSYFSDIQWALNKGESFQPKRKKEHITLVMNSQRVQQMIKQLQWEQIKKLGRVSQDPEKDQERIAKQINKQAYDICDQMFADYNFRMIRMMGWLLNKVFRQVYEKVVVDESYLKMLSQHDQKKKGPLIFIPTHKSYVDFVIASYIFYAFKIKCPHVASSEDFLQLSIVPAMIRAGGAFFLKKKQYEGNLLYKTIFYEYIQRLLMDECYLEFFVEGTRSRTGKILAPKFGLLDIVVDSVVENKIPDATLIPITINYERVLEADTYPMELLGENKVKESILRIIKAAKLLTTNQGRIYVEFGDPVVVRQQLLSTTNSTINSTTAFDPLNNLQDRQQFTQTLGYNLVYTLIDKLVIMPTSMVAAIALMHRKGIQEEELIKKIEWLSNQVIQRGGKIGSINDCSAVIAVRNSINHLNDAIVKTKKNIFELSVSPNMEYKNILLLSYYKNQLLHLFFQEAVCLTALNSFGHQLSYKEGITVARLWEETEFLLMLLSRECFVRQQVRNIQQFQQLLDTMVARGILTYMDSSNSLVKVQASNGEQSAVFLCSLIWPLVESYWVTLIYIYSIQRNHTQILLKRFIQQVQWFAESMYEERVMEHYESCSQETVTNAVQSYNHLKMISVEKELNEKNQQVDEYVKVIVNEEKLLEQESYIKKFMKNAFTKSVKTPIDIVKNDLPIMAKL